MVGLTSHPQILVQFNTVSESYRRGDYMLFWVSGLVSETPVGTGSETSSWNEGVEWCYWKSGLTFQWSFEDGVPKHTRQWRCL